ncbi:MAG: hypothetical protein QM564_03555 [Bergeyella sp.]
MNNLIKTLIAGFILIVNLSCAQTVTMKSLSDAKKLELNKKEFVGKSLGYFLKHIGLEIKSIKPAPNKNLSEVNRISFMFVPYNQYRNDRRDITEKPTTITVVFNQNWDLLGNRCRYDIQGCTEWTKEDEKRLGDLIIYDIYVLGKD